MPFTEGKTERGWGVFREKPWHLAGVFRLFQEARAKARELGPDYQVKLGQYHTGSDDFVFSTQREH